MVDEEDTNYRLNESDPAEPKGQFQHMIYCLYNKSDAGRREFQLYDQIDCERWGWGGACHVVRVGMQCILLDMKVICEINGSRL